MSVVIVSRVSVVIVSQESCVLSLVSVVIVSRVSGAGMQQSYPHTLAVSVFLSVLVLSVCLSLESQV